ncbi:alkaline phosphatase family protein [Thalassotalea marina]|uniref:Phosphoglyceromutase n=1 Tax=Thalassotalea marina TaxID=1673741 RepID=A0A919EKV7_9GAMM|nr:alkaline phosphatase family protein [Thalassotalea marina]GHF91069.1 hypothetical protein GCM10017161_18550 [Thalassotalea marina]
MKKLTLTTLLLTSTFSMAQERNLVLVTIDGLRWQEVFQGKQQDLLDDKNFTHHKNGLLKTIESQTTNQAKETLMPFVWSTIAKNGTLVGDRNQASNMSVANQWHFSYPGYSEIFTGVTNPTLDSNAKKLNPETSFLEWLKNNKGYKNTAAFGSWDVFPYILNAQRSGLYVNAGFDSAPAKYHSDAVTLLNELQQEIPSPWHNVRLDSFTHRFAIDYIKENKPRVVSISYGETDDFAHDGRYDNYLNAAHRTDAFIADLWQTLQSMEQYKNNTNLLIVTDHGRGQTAKDWQHHASKQAVQAYMKGLKEHKEGVIGSAHIWFAALGPDIKPQGVLKTSQELYQKQVAATALTLLDENVSEFNPKAGKPMLEVIK